MELMSPLYAYGLSQVFGESALETVNNILDAVNPAQRVLGSLAAAIRQRFTDHSQTLPRALARANEQAWQAIAVALAGDGWVDAVRIFFTASGDQKGLRDEVRRLLENQPPPFGSTPQAFRKTCLAELTQARKEGLLSLAPNPRDIADRSADFRRYEAPNELFAAAVRAVDQTADGLAERCPNLAQVLRQRPANGPPLLAGAFAWFFRQVVEMDAALSRGLTFDKLQILEGQLRGVLEEVGGGLASLGNRFDERLDDVVQRLEHLLRAAHQATLDLHAALNQLAGQHLSHSDEIRLLLLQVLKQLERANLRPGEVRPRDTLSIRSEAEKRAVRELLTRFRQLPAEEQQQVPALLNGLGRLQVGAGDFAGARQTFIEVAGTVGDAAVRAEARYNAFRAALAERKWDEALAAIREAAELCPARFAPFPLKRYQARRILGSGGFGTAFLCYDPLLKAEVVVKVFHSDDLNHDTEELFGEAQVLLRLRHANIIDVLHCDYADSANLARPYLVMEYFPGMSLQAFVNEHGVVTTEDLLLLVRPVAEALFDAHARGILHLDLKPDNVLVLREGQRWRVKIIDLGLARGRENVDTEVAGYTDQYAPDEQKRPAAEGRRQVGPYSDIYAFGKMCCYALFRTTEPRIRHWNNVPTPLRDLLESCMEQAAEDRPQDFGPVLEVLRDLDPVRRAQESEALLIQRYQEMLERTQDNLTSEDNQLLGDICRDHRISLDRAKVLLAPVKAQYTRRTEEIQARKREVDRKAAEEKKRQQEALLLRGHGEEELAEAHRQAFDRSRGTQRADGSEICRRYGIAEDRANTILSEVWEQWQRDHPTPKERRAGAIETVVLGGGVEMKFAWCPPGTFLMGSPAGEVERSDDELQHRVTLTKGFWLGIHQVTQAQWQAVMGDNPSHFKGVDLPVDNVSWEDCQKFVEKAVKKIGKMFRVPTEAEWEYACRAGTTTPFAFGQTISTDQANYDGNYTYADGRKGVYRKKTTPVGTFPANPWGLHDMHGNVWEWCADWYGPYHKEDLTDPKGIKSGDARVLRGGSWNFYPRRCRSACRTRRAPGYRDFFGCRVVLCLD
jgi:formylglycine-generating enzyme required for sulfatase activity/serine/threonine protein kinase